ncbi:MAG: Uma2 family endonuclease [Chloroflexota bacterium]|nr:Uma2 family endonuclease [Chloroflexota bacterium]
MAVDKANDLDQLIYDGAIRLEITAGVPTWEAYPSVLHQETIDLIRTSVEPAPYDDTGCACAHLSDVLIRFKDGSLKRPDIAIFCTRPPRGDDALTMIPEAVIEIISPGYEYKDLYLNPQFYLAQGVADVVIVDPRAGIASHFRTTGTAVHHAPVTLNMQCGCRCTIPPVVSPT